MKQGVIVYLLGSGEPPAGIEPGTHYQGLRQPAGLLEVVVSRQGILELDDAWHFLLNQGCDPIHLLVTEAEQDHLRPLYPLLRLSAMARVAVDPSGACENGRVLH